MIRPLGDRVVVEPKQSEEKTKAGVYIPASAQKLCEGVIVSIGDGTKECPMCLKQAQTILFQPGAGVAITHEDRNLLILSISARDIAAVKHQEGLIPLPGFAFVKTNFERKASLSYGSLSLFLNTSWNPEQHAVDYGEIITLPEGYAGILQVGDVVYGNHLFIQKENEYQKQGIDSIVLVEQDQVYCYIRRGEVYPMPDKLLIEPIEEAEPLPSWLINPFRKTKERMAKVVAVSIGETRVKPGDVVAYTNNANYRFEIDGKPYECLHAVTRQLVAVLEPSA